MVYCGKPSEACGPCRAKKTRCDKVRPSCGQCRRTKTECGGYRDASESLFRDQTSTIAKKVQSRQANQQALVRRSDPKKKDETVIDNTNEATKAANTTNLLARCLLTYLDDFASVSFYNHYVTTGVEPGKDSLGLDPSVYLKAGGKSPLSQLLIALGLVSHPVMRRDGEMLIVAQRRYTKALSLTNQALSDPALRLKDETLMTIILLAVYELLTGTGVTSVRSWLAHVNGSINLLILRGRRQFKSKAGVAMFIHMRTRIILSCLQREVAVPEELVKLSEVCKEYLTPVETKSSELANHVIPLTHLRAVISDGSLQDQDEIVRRTLLVDEALTTWSKSLPPAFLPAVVPAGDMDVAGLDFCYLYPTKFIAGTQMNFLAIKLIASQIRRFHLPYVVDRTNFERRYSDTNEAIRDASRHLCAGMPYFLGDIAGEDGQKQRLNLYGASNLIWLLHPIIWDTANPREMRNWAYNQLLRISEQSGLQQAKSLADIAMAGIDITDWIKDRRTTWAPTE